MNDLLAKIMAKKGQDQDMDPDYKNSKMAVLQALKDEMTKMMGGDLGSLKKVTVAAPDQAGLQDGLKQAQALMGKGVDVDDDSNPATADDAAMDPMAYHEHEADDADASMVPAEGSDMEHSDDSSLDAMSPEEMKALLKQLMAAKA